MKRVVIGCLALVGLFFLFISCLALFNPSSLEKPQGPVPPVVYATPAPPSTFPAPAADPTTTAAQPALPVDSQFISPPLTPAQALAAQAQAAFNPVSIDLPQIDAKGYAVIGIHLRNPPSPAFIDHVAPAARAFFPAAFNRPETAAISHISLDLYGPGPDRLAILGMPRTFAAATDWPALSDAAFLANLAASAEFWTADAIAAPTAPAPRPSLFASADPIVTLAEFNQIQSGMSYAQVCRIIGADGEVISESTIQDLHTVMYSWSNGLSNMNAMFQNDKLISKAQLGLQ